LKERFGPEYDRVAADAPSRREAEAELREREERRSELRIRPLDPRAADRYRIEWHEVQAEFVDDPAGAVTDADVLIQSVMRERRPAGRAGRRRDRPALPRGPRGGAAGALARAPGPLRRRPARDGRGRRLARRGAPPGARARLQRGPLGPRAAVEPRRRRLDG